MRKAAPLIALLLVACGPTVYGPGVLVLPGTNKSFDQFRFDEQECRGYAQARVTDSGAEWDSAGSTQQRYDRAFLQCMYAKGHRVPVPASARYSDAQPQAAQPQAAQPQAAQPPAAQPPVAQPPVAQPQAAVNTPPPPPPGEPPAEAPPDFRSQ